MKYIRLQAINYITSLILAIAGYFRLKKKESEDEKTIYSVLIGSLGVNPEQYSEYEE